MTATLYFYSKPHWINCNSVIRLMYLNMETNINNNLIINVIFSAQYNPKLI